MRILKNLIILLIFALPVSSIIPCIYPVWYPQYLVLSGFLFLILCAKLLEFDKWIGLFLAYLTYSTFFVAKLSPRAIICLYQISLALFAVYAISFLSQKYRRQIFNSLTAIAVIQFIWVVIQMFNKDPIFHVIGNTRIDNAVGFCGSWDISGIFIAATAPFLFSRKLWLVLIPAIGIVACRSSFSMMALILSFLFYILISHRKLLKFILPVVCILGLIFFYRDGGLNKSKFMERFEICQVVTKSILQGNINIRNSLEEDSTHIMKINSWTGVGLGNFLSIFPYYPGKYFNIRNSSTGLFNHAHNDYIEAFFEFGIIGGIILFGLILSNLFKLIISVKINKEILVYVSCLIAYLVNAAGIFASHIAVSVFLLIIIWGLSRSVLREVRSSYGTVAGLE